MDWNKLIKCFGIVITAFTFLWCLFVVALIYPTVAAIIFEFKKADRSYVERHWKPAFAESGGLNP